MPENSVKNIGGILNGLMKKYGLEQHVAETNILKNWESIVGKSLAKRCRPKHIKNGILYVETNNAVWRQELAMKRQELLNLFVKKLTNYQIRDIKFI